MGFFNGPKMNPTPFNKTLDQMTFGKWGKFQAGQIGYWHAPAYKRAGMAYSKIASGNSIFILGSAAFGAYNAPTGKKISSGLAGGISIAASTGISLGISALTGLPPVLTDLAVQSLIGPGIEKIAAGIIQPMVDFGQNQRRVNFGGDYRDTQTAATMRQSAAREMSRSLMNARQWLGQEGAFMAQ